MQIGPARTAHLFASVRATFDVLPLGDFSVGQGVVSLVSISGVHKQLLLIVEDGKPARLHFAALVHCTLYSHVPGHVGVGVASDRLSEVSMKEGFLISWESCHHCPEVRQPPPIPIVIIRLPSMAAWCSES